MKYNIIRTISLYDMYQNKHTNSHTAKLYRKTVCQASPDKPKNYELVTMIFSTRHFSEVARVADLPYLIVWTKLSVILFYNNTILTPKRHRASIKTE